MTRIIAILVNYNGDRDTVECLDSLKVQAGVDCTPLVIDNASRPDSVARIRRAHADVEIIRSETNLGFCGGNNVGLRRVLEADCDYAFLVNNDTVLEPDCLERLVGCARSFPEAAAITPAIYCLPDVHRPWFTGSRIEFQEGIIYPVQEDLGPVEALTPFAIPWTTGCAMLMPADKLRRVGGLDERYFCYWEDTDWSFRAGRSGYTCILCPAARLYHRVGRSSSSHQRAYYFTRNQLLFLSLHAPEMERKRLVRLRTRRILQSAKHWLRYGRRGDAREFLAPLMGGLDFHRRRYGRCPYAWL